MKITGMVTGKRSISAGRAMFAAVLVCTATAATPAFAERSVSARGVLAAQMNQVQFNARPLETVIKAFADATGANVVADWTTLKAAGVAKDTPVTLNLHRVTVRAALKNVLASVAPANTPLTYYVEDNVLTLTTQDEADKHLVTRIYDVNDLLMPKMNLQLTQPGSLSASTGSANGQASNMSGGSGSGSGGIFGSQTSQQTQQTTVPNETKDDKAKALVKAVQEAFRPGIWKENGGNSSIVYYDGKLIVTAPYEVQEQIGGPVPDNAQVAAAH